jgi:hypothetical protein
MMKRIACAVLLAGAVLAVVAVRVLGDGLSGNWTVNLIEQGAQHTFWLLKLEDQSGKVSGSVEPAENVPESSLHDLRVDGDVLQFTVKVKGVGFDFQGKVPKGDAKKILGSVARGALMIPAVLERTSATDLKNQEATKKIGPNLPKQPDGKTLAELKDSPLLFEVARDLFREAPDNKTPPAQVREWYDLVARAAAAYGRRWQREIALRTAEALTAEKGYAAVAEDAARQALAAGGPALDTDTKLRGMTALSAALQKEGKEPEYQKAAAALDALENTAYQEHAKDALPFRPEKFGGRKDKSGRAVLVELFTGAQCPPCVAADMAFDGLEKTYTPKEVVLLQYHVHIPGPDPLTNPETMARLQYYGDQVEGTPSIFFNGKPEAGGGGFAAHAAAKYDEYRKVIEPLLEKPTPVKLEATAVRKGDKLHITATASGIDKPGEKVRLRLVLVEEWARYRGGNGLSYHHRIVRQMPGGPQGLALTKTAGKQDVTVEVDALRNKLAAYLINFTRTQGPFPGSNRPLRLQDLRVVAFVQNDETKEVLQAVETPIHGADAK